MARFTGTRGNDRFSVSTQQLAGSTVSGGDGVDTLAISNTGTYTFSKPAYASLSSVEVIDVSAHRTGTLTVLLDSTMMAQSGNGTLTIVSGQAGIANLKAGSSVGGQVFISGTGTVWMDNATNNIVRVASGSTAAIQGRDGSDTIYASATGSVVDGGGGNDSIYAGSGADTIAFGNGDKRDTVRNFDVANDKIDLSASSLTHTSQALVRVSDTAAGAQIDLGNGDVLVLAGISAEQLTSVNFKGLINAAPTYTIASDVTATQLQGLLDSAGDGATFILADGLHLFDRGLVVRHDNVTIRGESEAGTILRFAFAPGTETDGITVKGGNDTLIGTTTATIAAGQTALTLSTTSGLKAGDTLYIRQPNDAAYMAANGWTNVSAADYATRPFREVHVEIERIEGTTVHLRQAIPMAMDAGATEVFRTSLVRGATLEQFTIDSGLGAANAYDFANVLATHLGLAAVRIDGSYGAQLTDISIIDPFSHGFDLHGNIDLIGQDLTVRGAWNKGSGGNGYGIQIGETFWSTLTGLDITDTRHAVLFSGWDMEAGNHIEVANTNRDINFHGGPDSGNEVIVAQAILAYDPAQNSGGERGYWPIVGDHVSTHANIDPYAQNEARFGHAVGSNAAERIFALDTASTLAGRGGNDVLIGGIGDDQLVGGAGSDTVTGGAGSDTFIMAAGSGFDTITDFAAGDRLVFSGSGMPVTLAELTRTDTDAGVWVTYAGGGVFLAGQAAAGFGATDVAFDTASAWGHLV